MLRQRIKNEIAALNKCPPEVEISAVEFADGLSNLISEFEDMEVVNVAKGCLKHGQAVMRTDERGTKLCQQCLNEGGSVK